MDKKAFVKVLQEKMKMVRTEAGYTQDTMSDTIGLSKKTLVQIEKERILPNWTTCLAISALFRDSQVLINTFGGDPLEIAQQLSRGVSAYPDREFEGIYWETLETKDNLLLEFNKKNSLYRVCGQQPRPYFTSIIEREAWSFFKNY
ncbi:helix-turn-helix transcriptional regulator [Aliicoccus persicus]|uniref:DNA-binding transcriptional regulator, XRE-family HTH domain n=1 Tax=Aliicoccus persicus TaxID=930138 RepID=A0A662Z5G9_9STAP|nr:helix-turn-helix domain-containing protein [Aliicoccus persicus]SEW19303.1 DNA-binding transcriptional regulator, XRE-family HTH domain [Aliicoccus persicus]